SVIAQLLLNVYVEVLCVGGADFRVDTEEVAQAAKTAKHRSASNESRSPHRGINPGGLNGRWPDSRQRRARTEGAVIRNVRHKNVLREGVVEQSPSAADYRLGVAGKVIG